MQEIERLRQAGCIASAETFAQEAIPEKILSARREQFVQETEPLRRDLADIGLSEDAILKEFDRFRHAAHAHR